MKRFIHSTLKYNESPEEVAYCMGKGQERPTEIQCQDGCGRAATCIIDIYSKEKGEIRERKLVVLCTSCADKISFLPIKDSACSLAI